MTVKARKVMIQPAKNLDVNERQKWGKQTTQPIDQVSNMIFH